MTLERDDDPLLQHLRSAFARARLARAESQAILDAGLPSAALVWAVRAAEILMRDFVLAPHFIEQGSSWEEAMREGSRVLGSSAWSRAFAKAEEWYGPFDEPLTTEEANAWKVWINGFVRLRGDLVHGRAVVDVSADLAADAIVFAERMSSWYAERFLTSSTHPMGQHFRALFEELRQWDTENP